MALEASGNWHVWSFTWNDLNAKFGYADAGGRPGRLYLFIGTP